MKLTHWLALALLAAATNQAGAQAQVRRIADAPAAHADTTAPTIEIFSTLSTDPSAIYDYGWGPSIMGPRWHTRGLPGHGPEQYWGVAFTPASDISLTQVVLPLAQDGDRDLMSVRVSIYSDADGLPGQALQTWKGLTPQRSLTADNFARTCCTYSVVNAKPGAIPLKGGTTYWLVAGTLPNSHFTGLWYYNSIGAKGLNAYFGGLKIWQQQPDALLPAVGIYGVAK